MIAPRPAIEFAGDLARVILVRCPKFSRRRQDIVKIPRHHTDDGVIVSVELYHVANSCGISTKELPPKSVAENDYL